MSADEVSVRPEAKSPEKSPAVRGVAANPSLRARGPAKGAPNAGRPKLAFAEKCKALQRGVVMRKVEKCLNDKTLGPGNAAWEWATRWISKYGEKETARRFEHGGLDGGPILLEQILREQAGAPTREPHE